MMWWRTALLIYVAIGCIHAAFVHKQLLRTHAQVAARYGFGWRLRTALLVFGTAIEVAVWVVTLPHDLYVACAERMRKRGM